MKGNALDGGGKAAILLEVSKKADVQKHLLVLPTYMVEHSKSLIVFNIMSPQTIIVILPDIKSTTDDF